MANECWMWDKEKKECGGYNYSVCPENCKFKKTKAEQIREETMIREHIVRNKPFLHNDFESMVGQSYMYINADRHNLEREQED